MHMITINDLKSYILSNNYKIVVEHLNLNFDTLQIDHLQILNIYTSLLNKLNISLADFKEIHVDNEHFIKYYQAFLVYADKTEQNEDDEEDDNDIEDCEPYKSFLIPHMAEFIALSKSKELLIKHHKNNDPKGYKQHIKKLEELLITSKN